MIKYTILDTPIGEMACARDEIGIRTLILPEGRMHVDPDPSWVRDDAAFEDVRVQLGEYFAGSRASFDLPLHLIGSSWQKTVWKALLDIPCGETESYGALAARIGAAGAARAVGLANGQNPIPIIVPCHRVLPSTGGVGGYGGGPERKRVLLELEGALPAPLS
jgi:methylated-DNA-[protein]-cysteine S-methyltransferase